MTELEKIEAAIAYRKEHRQFFRKFLFFYKVANNKVVKALQILCTVLMIAVVVIVLLHVFSVLQLKSLHWKILGVTFPVSLLLLGLLSMFESKQDEMYEYYPVDEMMTEMYGLTMGLHYNFWKPGRLKKIRKLLKKGGADSIVAAAKVLKPKYDKKKLMLDVDSYNEVSVAAVARQNKVIAARNKKLQKEQAKLERSALIWGALAEMALGDSSVSLPTVSDAPAAGGAAPARDYKAEADAKYKADLEARKQQFAKDAVYWESEYVRLKASDPECRLLATQKAEYNKNYYRRRSIDG